MKKIITNILIICLSLLGLPTNSNAQDSGKSIDVESLKFEEMKSLTQDELLQIPFEDLVELVRRFKLSSIDELYNLIMNPTQSTASKMEEELFSSPLTTSVITAREIEQSGVLTIPEALRLIPGVIVREKTNGNYDVHLRGNDYIPPGSDLSNSVNSTTLVMINNRPVYNSFLGATFWENLSIDIYDIEKIEIVFGPASALYGPNAVSGVIHILTKKAEEKGWKNRVDAQAGTSNSQKVYVSSSFSGEKINAKISGNFTHLDRFEDEFYIPMMDSFVSGEEAQNITANQDTTFQTDEASSDYSKAMEKAGLNLFLSYKPNEKFRLDYDGGVQTSSVRTSYMDIGSVLAVRETKTFANNLNLQYGGFDANFSAVTGNSNAVRGLPGYEYDYTELSGKLGYNYKFKNLTVRPGLDVNYASYSDTNYVDITKNEGLLNGEAELGTIQGSLRLDYTLFEKWRLTGAWMQGYFYEPGEDYSSYQFATTYNVNKNTVFRFVTSKANSSPTILKTYMNKEIEMGPGGMNPEDQPTQMVFKKTGNKDLSSIEMNMTEFGFRHKFMRNLQADFSVFYNKSENYSLWTNEMTGVEDINADEIVSGQTMDNTITETVENTTANSTQFGASIKFDYVLDKSFNASLFATIQKTFISDLEVSDSAYFSGLTGSEIDRNTILSNPVSIDLEHTYTPSFYGGATINYTPSEKWNFNLSLYGYSKQKTFYKVREEFKWLTIDPKLIANLKVNYSLTNLMDIYVNIRDLTNDSAREFMFTDKTNASILGGLSLRF